MMLVLGTRNRKKGAELAELLAPYRIEIRTLADFAQKLDVTEDGQTFMDNAKKKAAEQAKFLHAWVIGEDSGLCVDALDGAPGVFSARFAAFSGSPNVSGNVSENASDEDNNQRLLEKLAAVPPDKRTARYVCTAALSDPEGNIRGEVQGICRGRILSAPEGTGGFGYDPLFEISEYHRTFGLLPSVVKQMISHRARAMRKLIPIILQETAAPDASFV
ncbi:MAG: non-canonical purine NTP pyrophosphatase [Planctomycetaceae bacterium]|nr:non-canonical purine NTP pyrophosphatase [Planctomycetaceae bacterium]